LPTVAPAGGLPPCRNPTSMMRPYRHHEVALPHVNVAMFCSERSEGKQQALVCPFHWFSRNAEKVCRTPGQPDRGEGHPAFTLCNISHNYEELPCRLMPEGSDQPIFILQWLPIIPTASSFYVFAICCPPSTERRALGLLITTAAGRSRSRRHQSPGDPSLSATPPT
jgi:hypothetical protein